MRVPNDRAQAQDQADQTEDLVVEALVQVDLAPDRVDRIEVDRIEVNRGLADRDLDQMDRDLDQMDRDLDQMDRERDHGAKGRGLADRVRDQVDRKQVHEVEPQDRADRERAVLKVQADRESAVAVRGDPQAMRVNRVNAGEFPKRVASSRTAGRKALVDHRDRTDLVRRCEVRKREVCRDLARDRARKRVDRSILGQTLEVHKRSGLIAAVRRDTLTLKAAWLTWNSRPKRCCARFAICERN